MSTFSVQRQPPVPYELRRQIAGLLDLQKLPIEIATELRIPEISAHQVLASREHMLARSNVAAHRAATAKFTAQLERLTQRHDAAVKIAAMRGRVAPVAEQNTPQAHETPARKQRSAKCLVTTRLSVRCSGCERRTEEAHVVDVKIYCARCCSSCGTSKATGGTNV